MCEDRFHCGVVLLVVWAGMGEGLVEDFEIDDLGNVEEGLALRAALQLMNAQQFGAARADSITLRLNKSRPVVVHEA